MRANTLKKTDDTKAPELETKRLHERVQRYWADLKEQRMYPRREEVDPQALGDAWQYCFVVDMRAGKVEKGFHYEHMGAALNEAYGRNMLSVENCDTKTEPHIASMLQRFNEVVESGELALDESEFKNAQGKAVKYRCCLLPLGRDKVEYVLGCMRWKAY